MDADHIAAIDNVTRRLIQDGRQPLLTGLYFSLGHSSVVCLMSMVAVSGSTWLETQMQSFPAGKLIATGVSAGLLLVIGVANGAVAVRAATRRDEPGGHAHDDHEHGGFLTRCCPWLVRVVDAEWKMALVGFLFGLGFETSSEVALLALTAMSPTQGVPAVATLVLPLLFAGAMSMIDTLDGLMMYWAYGFAVANPGGRRLYNLYLTTVSAVVAVGVGSVELLGCLQHQFRLHGPFWKAIAALNENFEYVGYSIIALFGCSAIAAVLHVRCERPPEGPIVIPSPKEMAREARGEAQHQKAPVWWGKRRWG